MWRTVGAIVAGLLVWMLVVTLINLGLRIWLPGYVHVEHALQFTFTMKIARLLMAAVTSLIAGAVVRLVAPASALAPWIVGGLLLLLFIPSHVQLWTRFPIWYHASFLLPLAPLVALGARMAGRARPA